MRRMQHALAHAPEDQAADLSMAPAAHDDDIRVVLLGRLDNFARWVSFPVDTADLDVTTGERLCGIAENRFAGLLHPLLERRVIDIPFAEPSERDRGEMA